MQKFSTTILIVDDDVQVLRSLCFLLEAEGYVVKTYESSQALLDESRLPENACLVIDYRMPDINGLDLLTRLRERFPKVPALLITGYPDDSIETRAAHIGIKVVRKPHLDDTLLHSIQQILAPA